MKLIKNTLVVGVLTLLSRVFGYVRDAIVAFYIGAGPLNDAFIVAFRLPNLFRTIFGEGAFSSAFIPIYSKVSSRNGLKEAGKFASQVQTLLLLLLLILSAFIMIFMEEVILFTALGYRDQPHYLSLITQLARITFPYIIFISLFAFYGGMLNSQGKYFAFASAPVILNIVLILAIIYEHEGEAAAFALAYGALVAGILEFFWVAYFAYKSGIKVGFIKPRSDENLKRLFKTLVPGIIGSGISQINVWVSTILASFVPSGISYLYYSDRIYQLPLALIGTAMGTVLLPVLSKHFGDQQVDLAVKKQNEALEFSMLLAIPSALALSYLSYEIVAALFQHGEFSVNSAQKTADALRVFAIGIPAYILIKIFAATFFANHDTKTPVQIAGVVLVINLSLSYALLGYIEHVAIAVGSVISAWLNAISLIYFSVKCDYYNVRGTKIIKQLLKFVFASFIMILAIYFVETNFASHFNQLLGLIIYGLVGSVCYLLILLLTSAYKAK